MNEGNRETFFRLLYDEYHRVIFAFLLSQTGHRETAKDLLQEVFLRVWNGIDAGYGMGLRQARYWVYRIARNLVVDHYRRQSVRRNARKLLEAEGAAGGRSASAEETFESADRLRRVDQAVSRLPDELRAVLVLHLVGQLNSKAIGELLELPAGTVRYRLSMARKRLRESLDDGHERIRDGARVREEESRT